MELPRTGLEATPLSPTIELHRPAKPRQQKLNASILSGVYEVYIDVSQQKLTVVGRVDPEKIVKVIKRTRKTAAICPPPEPASTETPPPPDPPASTESTTPATGEAAPPSEALPAETPAPEVKPESQSKETAPENPKNEEQIHMIHYYPHSSIYRERWNAYPRAYEISHESFPHYVIQNYNGYKSSSSPPPQRYEFYGDQSHQAGDGGQITSIFSDENPNACAIV
ncbi:hypothetical protein KSP40_PGU015191 [Platanthera guangdongensis]|uniref:HMA domain-containing protein n=1 Tax=Platanthera guangdongensis TaxID=2320717 RepID=A0ABR2M8W0_9ASPA